MKILEFFKEYWNGTRPGDPNPAAFQFDLTSQCNEREKLGRVVARRRTAIITSAIWFLVLALGGAGSCGMERSRTRTWETTKANYETRITEQQTKIASVLSQAESWQKAAESRKKVTVRKKPVLLDADKKLIDYAWTWATEDMARSTTGGSTSSVATTVVEAVTIVKVESVTLFVDRRVDVDVKKSPLRFHVGPGYRPGPDLPKDLDRVGGTIGGRFLGPLGASGELWGDGDAGFFALLFF